MVVNFWATWCGPCKLEMPWFESADNKYKPQGLVILGLSQDDGTSKDKIAAAAKQIGVSYPILLPDDNVAGAQVAADQLGAVEVREGRPIQRSELGVDRVRREWVDIPSRMPNLIHGRAAVAALRVTPVVLGEELLLAARGDGLLLRRRLHGE